MKENRLKGRVGLAALILLTIVALIGCSKDVKKADDGSASQVNEQKKESVTFRYQSGASYGGISPFELADKLGYYKDTSVKIESVGVSKSGPEDIQAIAAGSNDIAWTNTGPVINSFASGLKLKEIVSAGSPIVKDIEGKEISIGGILVHKDSGINSAKDLVGKKISVNIRSAQAEYAIIQWLEDNGVNPDDVELVIIAPPNEVQAVQKKQVDAAYSWTPSYDKALEDPNIKVLVTEGDILGDFSPAGFTFSQEFLDNNPEAVREFVEGYVNAWSWAWENPKELQEIAKEIIADFNGNTDLAKYVRPFGKRENALIKDSDIEFYIKQLVKLGKIKKGQVKPEDIYTNEFNPYAN